MRRGVILVVPIRVFTEQGIELTPKPGFVYEIRYSHPRQDALYRLGVCPAAIRACDRWWEDVKTDCICFRFRTEEHESTMPGWSEFSTPCHVCYDWNSFGDLGWRADMLNAYFPKEPSEPEAKVAKPRRLLSLEG